MASALFFAVACWGEGVCIAGQNRLDKLVREAGPVVGAELQTAQQMAEARFLNKLGAILDNPKHPLHALKLINNRDCCTNVTFRKSFMSAAIRL